MDLSGKRVNILGAGTSGRAAAALALREGAEVHVFDGHAEIPGLPAGAVARPDAGPGSAEPCDLLVVSPGVPTFGEFVAAFSAVAGETVGEIELACRYYDGRIIAITGTNGKTTTTELVERVMNASGVPAVACGNYGTPVCEVVMRDPAPAVLALEASSFQLETIAGFRPHVAVWLNFSPDHMDRYERVEDYRAAKLRIFENQRPEDVAVIRHGEELPGLAAKVVTFSTIEPGADWYSDGRRVLHWGELVLDLHAGSHLRGLHNAENAMAAIAAGLAAGAGRDSMARAFDGYAPPRHRCELVRTLDGVEWLNDSKATNLHALESALRSQDRPVVLIAGGKEKGLDYLPLLPMVAGRVTAVVTFGQIGRALAATLGSAVPAECVATLDEAVSAARRLAARGATVLFSPGTSSFDQFDGYQHRGDTFCQLVKDLR
jgi:UDP-N-acetylmuramoylalanine--D-glutamate ligase